MRRKLTVKSFKQALKFMVQYAKVEYEHLLHICHTKY